MAQVMNACCTEAGTGFSISSWEGKRGGGEKGGHPPKIAYYKIEAVFLTAKNVRQINIREMFEIRGKHA